MIHVQVGSTQSVDDEALVLVAPLLEATVLGKPEACWSKLKQDLKFYFKSDEWDQWIQPLFWIEGNEFEWNLAAPTPFVRDWVQERFKQLLLKRGRELAPHLMHIHIKHRAPESDPVAHAVVNSISRRIHESSGVQARASSAARFVANDASVPNKVRDHTRFDMDSWGLAPRLTFDSFVVGPSNQVGFNACQGFASMEDPPFNPLFLTGQVGLGKTHLMQATAWAIKAVKPDAIIAYLTAEQFMHEFVKSLRDRSMIDFKDTFRNLDVLMIDDIQFILGKNATQEEFFHTFNSLSQMGKRMIFSADKAPGELNEMHERIRSRLASGLVVQIHPADYELRLGILQKKVISLKSKFPQVTIESSLIENIAQRITSNIRELEGALIRLVAHAALTNRPLDGVLLEEILPHLVHQARVKNIDIVHIQDCVANYFGMSIATLIGQSKKRDLVWPRQLAIYLSKDCTDAPLVEIARKFGGRDHTTIMHSVQKVLTASQKDNGVKRLIEDLRQHIEQPRSRKHPQGVASETL